MSIRILHTADLHLGSAFKYLGDRAGERRRDLLQTFGRICDEAIKRHVAAVLIAGDLFDVYQPPSDLVATVEARIEALAVRGIQVYIIPGNHDEYSYPDSVWKQYRFSGARIFREPTFSTASFVAEGAPIHVHGLAYNYTVCKDPLPTFAPQDGVNIVMLHATVDVPDYRQVEQRYLPLTSGQVAGLGATYVALGHIHKPHVFAGTRGPYAGYPGSPDGLTIKETGDRYAALLEFDGGMPTVEHLKVNRRTVSTENVSVDEMTGEQMLARIKREANEDLLLTCRLVGAPHEVPVPEYLMKRLPEQFFYLSIEDRTDIVNSTRIEEIAGENTIRGHFVQAMRHRIEAAGDEEERATLELALKLAFLELEKRSAA